MKLISESAAEDQILSGLVSLLRDLQVDAYGFQRNESIATIFWSPEDFSLELAAIKGLSKEEMAALLDLLEPELLEAMILAGFGVIERYMKKIKGTNVHQHHRLYP